MTEARDASLNILRDCISEPLIARSASTPTKPQRQRQSKSRKNKAQHSPVAFKNSEDNGDAAEELAEFVDVGAFSPEKVGFIDNEQYIATELFVSFPTEVQNASYSSSQRDPHLRAMATDPMPPAMRETVISYVPPTVVDSLEAYGFLNESSELPGLMIPVFQDYISTSTAPPPIWSTTRTEACEICQRGWVPLSYHHLIPKKVHAKVLKRGWHEEWKLNSVAWLCRACHAFVHRIADHEELARHFFTVELLTEREDVQAWAQWVGRVRWKAR